MNSGTVLAATDGFTTMTMLLRVRVATGAMSHSAAVIWLLRAAGLATLKLPRRNFLHLAACATALPAVSRIAKIEIELLIERCVDRVVTPDHEQRVAVCRGVHDRLGADVGAATRPVVDYELLAESLRQPLADQARRDVVRAGGRDRHDQTHRPRWIGLRPSEARHGGESGRASGQIQKLTAGKFHWRLPP